MSNIFNFTDTAETLPAPAKVSYALEGFDPVVCTLIEKIRLVSEDQDLSQEASFEGTPRSEIDMEAEFEAFSEELNTLQQLADQFSLCENEFQSRFEQARNSITGQGAYECDSLTDINDLIDILSQSRLIRAYLDHAEQFGVSLEFDTNVQTAMYDRNFGKIRINPNLCETYKVLLSIYELRRHWQHRNGALLNPLNFAPESAVLVNRLQRADLVSCMLRGAWELKLTGYRAPWKFIENSAYKDIARAFTREAHIDFRTINNGLATTAAFEAWFLSERCRSSDRTLIKTMLNDTQEYVFDIHNEHSTLTPAIIAALGTVPLGKNYLSAHVDTIITDPIFSEVRDRGNANFLWFIKFERNFRETEHNLQKEFSKAADCGLNENPDGKQGSLHEQNIHKDNVIALFGGIDTSENADHKRAASGSGSAAGASQANIVYLRRKPNGRDQ